MKKGFTLVELIVVIVLLSLIEIFTFPSINKTLSERKEKLYNIQIENIKTSTESYINKNNLFNGSDKVIVTLCQLKQEGFTDENVKDPRTGSLIPDDSKIIVLKTSSGNKYKFEEGFGNITTCTKNDKKLIEYIELGSTYNENIEYKTRKITNLSPNKNNEVVEDIDTSVVSSYYIEYTLEDSTITKYLYVIDSTGPNIKYKENHKFIDENGNEFTSNIVGNGLIIINADINGLFEPYEVELEDEDQNITLTATSNVNLKIPGSYYIFYRATDSSGNTTGIIQTIRVEDKKAPIIDDIIGITDKKTSSSIVVSVIAHDNESGLHPRGAYSFDGGTTWQVDNSITINSNTILNIVVRDTALNETKITKEITNILKDDKNISYTINKGTLKNNGWFIDNVEVLIKPLVSNEYFDSFTYWITNNQTSNKTDQVTLSNIEGTTVSFADSTNGTYICGYVTKKDGSKTDMICSMVIRIDKESPTCEIITSSTGVNGVSGYINIKDLTSGPIKNKKNFTNLKQTANYEIEDEAGNKGTCTIKIVAKKYTKSCQNYATCPNYACGNNICYACWNSCQTTQSVCQGGYEYYDYYCEKNIGTTGGTNCTNQGGYIGGDEGRPTDCWVPTTCTGKRYDSCATTIQECVGGYDLCSSPSCGYQSCSVPACGCESWGNWIENGSCTSSLCQNKTEYYLG